MTDQTPTTEQLIGQLEQLAVSYPDQPIVFQLPDGKNLILDPQAEPYAYRGLVVVPLIADTEPAPAPVPSYLTPRDPWAGGQP